MVFDCSYELMKPAEGEQQYLSAHIVNAQRADLSRHLSAQEGAASASGGRHPLPTREQFAAWLAGLGFQHDMQAVVYDRQNSSHCGRLWWMLKWVGHEAVAVLDGGLQAWQAAGGALQTGAAMSSRPSTFATSQVCAQLVTTEQVVQQLGRPSQTLVDARSAQRYRGEVEPLDPVAGHIPGALNQPSISISLPMASSNPLNSCGPNLSSCSLGVTLPPWCTRAAAASAPSPTCWPWKSLAWDAPGSTPGAGANGAATQPGQLPRVDLATGPRQ